jgi:ferritin-like metal-binding protein YciE
VAGFPQLREPINEITRHNYFIKKQIKTIIMAEMKNLKDLLKHELEDLYSAEEQIIDALPTMINNAGERLLKKSLNDHLKITRRQLARLDKVKKMLGQEEKEEPGLFERLFSGEDGEHHCLAMDGIIEEAKKMMGEEMEPEVMDAAIIAAAQKVEHYEICGYGTAKAYALHLGFLKVAELIDETLKEEYDADDLLTQLAIGKVNLEAGGEDEVRGLRKLPAKKRAPASKKTRRATPRKASPRRRAVKSGSGRSGSTRKKSTR